MKIFYSIFLFLAFHAHSQIITTYAGNGTLGYAGDGGPATNAELIKPIGVHFDVDGDLLICHEGLIRKVNSSTGIISNIAGDGLAMTLGDSGPATNALINNPRSICTDATGNLYIADYWAITIRKIDAATNIISKYAGISLTPGYSGDGGPATNAKISGAFSIYIDTSTDVLYISDTYNYRIRKVNMLTGTITTFAGTGINGYLGDGGPATAARLSRTLGICNDRNGNLYIGDWDNACIRKVDVVTGTISTFAGNGTTGYSGDGGPATSAMLSEVGGICFDSCGNLFFSDGALVGSNYRIRRIDAATNIITTVAGNGTSGYFGDGGPATNAMFSRTYGITIDQSGNLYVADIDNNRIRKITSDTSSCYHSNSTLSLRKKHTNIISIFPNPSNSALYLDNVNANSSYQLFNTLGSELQRDNLKEGRNALSVVHLPPGLYLLALTDEEGKRTVHKIVKE